MPVDAGPPGGRGEEPADAGGRLEDAQAAPGAQLGEQRSDDASHLAGDGRGRVVLVDEPAGLWRREALGELVADGVDREPAPARVAGDDLPLLGGQSTLSGLGEQAHGGHVRLGALRGRPQLGLGGPRTGLGEQGLDEDLEELRPVASDEAVELPLGDAGRQVGGQVDLDGAEHALGLLLGLHQGTSESAEDTASLKASSRALSAAASSSFLGFADFRCVVGLVVDAVLVEGLARPFRLVRDDRLVLVRLAASSVAAFVEARFVVVVETFAAAAFERATAFDELAFDDAPFAVVVPPFDAPPSDAFPAFDAFFRDRRRSGVVPVMWPKVRLGQVGAGWRL